VPFKDAGKLAPEAIYNFAKKVFLEHGPADGIYMLGAGWHKLAGDRDARERLENYGAVEHPCASVGDQENSPSQ